MSDVPVLVDEKSINNGRWIILFWNPSTQDFAKTLEDVLLKGVCVYSGWESLQSEGWYFSPTERLQRLAAIRPPLSCHRVYTVGDALEKCLSWFERYTGNTLTGFSSVVDVNDVLHAGRPITWEERSSFIKYLPLFRAIYDLPNILTPIETVEQVCKRL